MNQVLYALAVLACPVGMGMMMWLMMRSNKNPSRDAAPATASEAEVAQLRAVQPSATVSVIEDATR